MSAFTQAREALKDRGVAGSELVRRIKELRTATGMGIEQAVIALASGYTPTKQPTDLEQRLEVAQKALEALARNGATMSGPACQRAAQVALCAMGRIANETVRG